MAYFSSVDFPHNLNGVWTEHWAYVARDLGYCVIVGEWGGTDAGPDHAWHTALVQFMLDLKVSSFMWSLNGNDGDTGGLLDAKWSEWKVHKVDLLHRLPATRLDGRVDLFSRRGSVIAGDTAHGEDDAPAHGAARAEGLLPGGGVMAQSDRSCGHPYGECTLSRCCVQAYGENKRITCYERDKGYAGCQDCESDQLVGRTRSLPLSILCHAPAAPRLIHV